jgi:hypothetical protein
VVSKTFTRTVGCSNGEAAVERIIPPLNFESFFILDRISEIIHLRLNYVNFRDTGAVISICFSGDPNQYSCQAIKKYLLTNTFAKMSKFSINSEGFTIL